MKVKELIEVLKNYPEDYEVRIYASYDDGHGLAGGVVQYATRDEVYNSGTITLWNEEG